MRRFNFLFFSSLCICLLGFSAAPQAQVKIHSHNDYTHERPLEEALEQGIYSIEADVFIQFDSLVVAHSRKELAGARGLKSQYLAPLRKFLDGDGLPPVLKPGQLMIDFKDPWATTYPVFLKELQPYLSMLRRKPEGGGLLLTISGNRPPDSTFHRYPDFIYFDGLPFRKYKTRDLKKVVMISDNFKTWSKWNGEGLLSEEDKAALRKVIDDAHQKGKPVRFWNAPDTEAAWKQLTELGADIINTDKITACKAFVNTQVKP